MPAGRVECADPPTSAQVPHRQAGMPLARPSPHCRRLTLPCRPRDTCASREHLTAKARGFSFTSIATSLRATTRNWKTWRHSSACVMNWNLTLPTLSSGNDLQTCLAAQTATAAAASSPGLRGGSWKALPAVILTKKQR